jgi:hypothetical protein
MARALISGQEARLKTGMESSGNPHDKPYELALV